LGLCDIPVITVALEFGCFCFEGSIQGASGVVLVRHIDVNDGDVGEDLVARVLLTEHDVAPSARRILSVRPQCVADIVEVDLLAGLSRRAVYGGVERDQGINPVDH